MPIVCQMVRKYSTFTKESMGKLRVGKVNVDANPVLSSKYNIRSVPFLFIFEDHLPIS